MKVKLRENCGEIDLESESTHDVFLIGKLAGKFKEAHSYPLHDGTARTITIDLKKFIEAASN